MLELDQITVETEGVKMQLNHLAVVSAIDSKPLSVNPYDPNTLKALESAIFSSPLGLNPKVDGQRLIAAILMQNCLNNFFTAHFILPSIYAIDCQDILASMDKFSRLCAKVVAKSSEDVKQSIRRARQKALGTIKKAGSCFPKDEAKRLEKEMN
ncbi:hypothetical protein DITRI_Ditri03aG0133800 [Diplodiscus trichospermus]